MAKCYEKHKGDMDKILETVMFADATEEERYRAIIHEMIDSKRLPAFDAFTKESTKKRMNRLKRAHKEAQEATALSKRKRKGNKENGSSMDSLVLALRASQQKRVAESEDLLEKLTAKYQKPEKKQRKRTGQK